MESQREANNRPDDEPPAVVEEEEEEEEEAEVVEECLTESKNNTNNNGQPDDDGCSCRPPPRRQLPARELHSAESVMGFMMEELNNDDNNNSNKPPQFQDYLKAQKRLKQARRQQRRSSLNLFDSINDVNVNVNVVEEGGAYSRRRNSGVSTRNLGGDLRSNQQERQQQKQRRSINSGSSRRLGLQQQQHRVSLRNLTGSSSRLGDTTTTEVNDHRRRSLQAMRALSRRHAGISSCGGFDQEQEWQTFRMDPDNNNNNRRRRRRSSISVGDDRDDDRFDEDDDTFSHQQQSYEDDDDDDDHSSSSHHNNHSLLIPWYCRPVQRQRWDDDQILPHINWGDLFFDLFYVAAAYNLGGMLISSMGTTTTTSDDWPRGIVYFIAIFGPLYNIWENDVVYSSRYMLVDYSHRIVAVVRFLCLGFAVLSIKPIQFLKDKHSAETLCLTSALFCESVMQLGLNLELYFWGEGDRIAIRNHTYRKIVYQFLPATLTYMAAAITAGVSYFSSASTAYHEGSHDYHHSPGYDQSTYAANQDIEGYNGDQFDSNSTTPSDGGTTLVLIGSDDNHGVYEENNGHWLNRLLGAAESTAKAASSDCKDGQHRILGAASTGGAYLYGADDCSKKTEGVRWTIADLPLILCLAIYLLNIAHNLFRKITNSNFREYIGQEHKDIREQYVPNNIDFMIHRYGEWIMLMIGESVLSLLIVETSESSDYYAIAGLGCLTVVVLQMLKFESEPSHADGHALWRSKLAALLFSLLIQILSMALIAFGVSYKIMLTKVVEQVYSDESEEKNSDTAHRKLAALPVITDRAVASLFCVSLSIALLSLEMMLGTHKGVNKSYQLLFHEIESFHVQSLNWPLMIISIFKLFLISFTATLSQWSTEPTHVTIIGFLVVTSMAITRLIGWGFVHHEEKIKEALNFVADQTRDLAQSTGSIARKTGSIAKKSFTAGMMDWSETRRSSLSNDDHFLDQSLWDPIVVTDKSGTIEYVNGTALNVFEYDSELELIGNNVSMLVGGGEADCHHLYMKHFISSGRRATTIGNKSKAEARRKDGSEFSCLIEIKMEPSSERLVGTIRPLGRRVDFNC